MYRITQVKVKNRKGYRELYVYMKELCTLYTSVKNTVTSHIRQHMTGLQKEDCDRYPNETESISLFRQYIPELNRKSAEYAEKRRRSIMENGKLTDGEKSEKLEKVKSVEYRMPTKEEWFLNYGVAEGVLRLSVNESYRVLPAQVNQNAMRDAENDWCSYFKSLKAFGRNPNTFPGKPEMPKYKRGMSTVTLTNQTCKLVRTEKSGRRKDTMSLRFPKTDCKLYMGRYFNGDTVLKEITIKPCRGYFMVIITTEVPDVAVERKELHRVVSIDVGGKEIITMVNNMGLRPVMVEGASVRDMNRKLLAGIDDATSILRRGHAPDDFTYPHTSKRICGLYERRDAFLCDYFHKLALYVVRYCKDNDIDTLVIGRNVGQERTA